MIGRRSRFADPILPSAIPDTRPANLRLPKGSEHHGPTAQRAEQHAHNQHQRRVQLEEPGRQQAPLQDDAPPGGHPLRRLPAPRHRAQHARHHGQGVLIYGLRDEDVIFV